MGEYLLFTEKDILERVDEYALYCHYTQEDIVIGGTQHLSPAGLRDSAHVDKKPSFGVYERRKHGNGFFNEFMWKDQGTGRFGDIFDLVQAIFNLTTRRDAMFRVMADFGIGGTVTARIMGTRSVTTVERKYADPVDIDIKSRLFDKRDDLYWNNFNVNRDILNMYNIRPISCYWIAESQKTPSFPKGLGYAYPIYDRFKLYFPSAPREKKFRNNYTEACLEGFQQLQYNSPLLIITKSTKDIMCLRSFGYEAVSPRGENVMVPTPFLDHFKERYERIIILFDNDGKHRGDDYEFEKVFVPLPDKDASDFCKAHGPTECADMLRQIIY